MGVYAPYGMKPMFQSHPISSLTITKRGLQICGYEMQRQ